MVRDRGADARAVDENARDTVGGFRLRERGLDLLLVGHVSADAQRP